MLRSLGAKLASPFSFLESCPRRPRQLVRSICGALRRVRGDPRSDSCRGRNGATVATPEALGLSRAATYAKGRGGCFGDHPRPHARAGRDEDQEAPATTPLRRPLEMTPPARTSSSAWSAPVSSSTSTSTTRTEYAGPQAPTCWLSVSSSASRSQRSGSRRAATRAAGELRRFAGPRTRERRSTPLRRRKRCARSRMPYSCGR
jgi:hypothetical protein